MKTTVNVSSIKFNDNGTAEVDVPIPILSEADQFAMVRRYMYTYLDEYFDNICKEHGVSATAFFDIPEFQEEWDGLVCKENIRDIVLGNISPAQDELVDMFEEYKHKLKIKYEVAVDVSTVVYVPVMAKDEDSARQFVNNMDGNRITELVADACSCKNGVEWEVYDIVEDDKYADDAYYEAD